MSERSSHRRPQIFKLDDPGVVVMDPDEHGRLSRGAIRVTPEPDPALLPVPIDAPRPPARRGFRWGALFWTALGGLVLLGLGLSVTHLIEDLFARNKELGFVGVACAIVAALALAVIIAREAFALARLATIEKLHLRAAEVLTNDDRAAEPHHRAGPSQDRAPEPATGPRPRRAAKPYRRHHRRRRHDQTRRARIDDTARSGSPPPGFLRRAAGLDRYGCEPARADRCAVRVRGLACG